MQENSEERTDDKRRKEGEGEAGHGDAEGGGVGGWVREKEELRGRLECRRERTLCQNVSR